MNHAAPLTRRLMACAGIAFAVSLVLTGCSNPIEKLIDTATSSVAESALSDLTGVEVETAEIPTDFPDSVPLPGTKPQVALSQTQDGVRSWILHFEEGIDDQAFDDLKAALSANGFAEDSVSDMSGAMRIAVYTSGDYMVNLSLLGSSDGSQVLQMMVFEEEVS